MRASWARSCSTRSRCGAAHGGWRDSARAPLNGSGAAWCTEPRRRASALPRRGEMIEAPTVRIEAFDLKGRRIAGNTIAVAQAGVHSAQLAGDPSFKPGISFLRLTQG